MANERAFGVLGIILSLVGVVATIAGAEASAWLMFSVGILCLIVAGWMLWARRALLPLGTSYYHEVKDSAASIVIITRKVTFRVLSPDVTTLWARSLTSTGKLRNFTTSLGRVSLEESTGGGLNVRVDLDRPLKLGRIYTWKLTYEAVDSFTQKVESVSLSSVLGGGQGELSVKFHSDQLDNIAKIRKSIFRRGAEMDIGELNIPDKIDAEIRWRFKLGMGAEYSIHWHMKSGVGDNYN